MKHIWLTSLSLCALALSFSFGAVVQEQDSAAAQQYSRQGCPTGLRAELWALILNSTNQPQVRRTFAEPQPGVHGGGGRCCLWWSTHTAVAFPKTACLLPGFLSHGSFYLGSQLGFDVSTELWAPLDPPAPIKTLSITAGRASVHMFKH